MVCLDTSFIIDLLRGRDNVLGIKNQIDSSSGQINVASPSVFELIAGAELSDRINDEKAKVRRFLSSLNILNLDMESAILAGEIEASLIKRGEKIEVEDVMIAAIAMKNKESLVTRNTKHFNKIEGLRIEGY